MTPINKWALSITIKVSCVATRTVVFIFIALFSSVRPRCAFRNHVLCPRIFQPGVYTSLQFLILYYLIKMYRALDPSENHQQPLTEARRNRGNRQRINDRADPHISLCNWTRWTAGLSKCIFFLKLFRVSHCFFLWRSCTVHEINSALLICSSHTRECLDGILKKKTYRNCLSVMQVSSVFFIKDSNFYFLV